VIQSAPDAALDVTRAGGAILRLRRHGNPAGPRLFVSHGNGFAIDGYVAFWRRLLADYDVVAFDMRHHGQSPLGDAAPHDYAHMIRDIDAMFLAAESEFGRRPSAGVFHSMSAQAAMAAAIEIGERFDVLIAFDPPNVPPADGAARRQMLAYLDRLTVWAAGRRAHFAEPAELARDYAATRAGGDWQEGAHLSMAQAVLRPGAGCWTLRCPPALESSIYEAGKTFDLWPHRGDFSARVKLIGSDPERGRPSPTALSNRDLAAQGGFDYTAIPGTGHLLQLEKPQACAEAVQEFIERAGLR
jgi:pimeloyl-ACP methyl ester carboxylesterase